MKLMRQAMALQLLAASGYKWVKTPATWRNTAEYLADLPYDAHQVMVLPKHWTEEGNDCYGLFSVEEDEHSTIPMVTLRRKKPETEDRPGRVWLKDFGPTGYWVAAVIAATSAPDRVLVEIMEPMARTAAALFPDDWAPADEQEWRELLVEYANTWMDHDFTIIHDPESQEAEVEFHRKKWGCPGQEEQREDQCGD